MAERRPPRRSRYAPDDQVKRALKLWREAELPAPTRLRLGADGSIELDSAPAASPLSPEEMTPEDALAAWEKAHGSARSQ